MIEERHIGVLQANGWSAKFKVDESGGQSWTIFDDAKGIEIARSSSIQIALSKAYGWSAKFKVDESHVRSEGVELCNRCFVRHLELFNSSQTVRNLSELVFKNAKVIPQSPDIVL